MTTLEILNLAATKSTPNIYAAAKAITEIQYNELYSNLSQEDKKTVKSLINLGDSKELALISQIAYKPTKEATEFYRYAYTN